MKALNLMDEPLSQGKNRIVRLMDYRMCLACRFAAIAEVEFNDGTKRRMLHCKRLDCDNWLSNDGNDGEPEVKGMEEA